MAKKISFILLMMALLLTACKSEQPASLEGDTMPCMTVYDYVTDDETDRYQAIIDQMPPLSDEDWMRGNPDAPITIYEYADFQCPACVGFAQFTEALLEYFPTSIKVVFRHLPLPSIHDKAFISGMAAEAAGAQGMFWEMHDFLYQFQGEWSSLSEDEFVDWVIPQAETLGLDRDQFELDLLDEEGRASLEAITEERLTLGMNYTPTVVINDRIYRDNAPDLFGLVGIHEFDGFEECPPWVINPQSNYTAILDTTAGKIEIELFTAQAPMAVNSFVFLAQNGWYDEVIFHRVIEDFVAQAGDPSGLGMVSPGYTFANETDNDLSFDGVGMLGMANSGADTNGSQFFITLAAATDLDGGYTIFGQVTDDSLAVLNNIALRDPQTAVDFESATIINGIEIIED